MTAVSLYHLLVNTQSLDHGSHPSPPRPDASQPGMDPKVSAPTQWDTDTTLSPCALRISAGSQNPKPLQSYQAAVTATSSH